MSKAKQSQRSALGAPKGELKDLRLLVFLSFGGNSCSLRQPETPMGKWQVEMPTQSDHQKGNFSVELEWFFWPEEQDVHVAQSKSCHCPFFQTTRNLSMIWSFLFAQGFEKGFLEKRLALFWQSGVHLEPFLMTIKQNFTDKTPMSVSMSPVCKPEFQE